MISADSDTQRWYWILMIGYWTTEVTTWRAETSVSWQQAEYLMYITFGVTCRSFILNQNKCLLQQTAYVILSMAKAEYIIKTPWNYMIHMDLLLQMYDSASTIINQILIRFTIKLLLSAFLNMDITLQAYLTSILCINFECVFNMSFSFL